jgi:hypothetical protein
LNAPQVAVLVDGLRFQCRVRELAFFDPASAPERAERIAASLSRLGAGRYVIGLGPNCQEVIRIGRHPVRLGRHASLLEEPREEVIDFAVNDASLHGPREVSRLHCTIDPAGCGEDELMLVDEASSTGTWIMPAMERIEAHEPTRIGAGSMFSLGPSGTNLFLFTRIDQSK